MTNPLYQRPTEAGTSQFWPTEQPNNEVCVKLSVNTTTVIILLDDETSAQSAGCHVSSETSRLIFVPNVSIMLTFHGY